MEYPKTYEEAKTIIKNSFDDDYNKHLNKKYLLRGGLITALAAGTAISLGAIKGNMTLPLGLLPIVGGASFLSFAPLIEKARIKKRLKNDELFKARREQDVIDEAIRYVDQYNQFVEEQKGRAR